MSCVLLRCSLFWSSSVVKRWNLQKTEREREWKEERKRKVMLVSGFYSTIKSNTSNLSSLFNFQIILFTMNDAQLIALTSNVWERVGLHVILTSGGSWGSVDLTESRGNATTRTLFNFPYSLDSWSENRFHICLIREISETRDGGGQGVEGGRGVHVWEREWVRVCGRERREGETLEATGYLSRYNGVSYEKTSVNFLSDLQQSITQSSHSADLWSCCLTESCHCSQPPTHRNSNFGLTNFPCNAIQLFFSLSWAYEAGDLCIFKSKEQSLGNVQG